MEEIQKKFDWAAILKEVFIGMSVVFTIIMVLNAIYPVQDTDPRGILITLAISLVISILNNLIPRSKAKIEKSESRKT